MTNLGKWDASPIMASHGTARATSLQNQLLLNREKFQKAYSYYCISDDP